MLFFYNFALPFIKNGSFMTITPSTHRALAAHIQNYSFKESWKSTQ